MLVHNAVVNMDVIGNALAPPLVDRSPHDLGQDTRSIPIAKGHLVVAEVPDLPVHPDGEPQEPPVLDYHLHMVEC